MDITQIVDLAKQGNRLTSESQWVLADALAGLSPEDVSAVAIASGRNENTLLQYARAAERWTPESSRVEGVTFSAHRVALSWYDPRQLLIDLKQKHGSPTVSQVRQAMGLEGHPALELIERGLRKMDDKVSVDALTRIVTLLTKKRDELRVEVRTPVATRRPEPSVPEPKVEAVANSSKGWTPPISTSDISGL